MRERESERASERASGMFFFWGGPAREQEYGIFFFGVGPPENRNMVRQFDARQYVALTLYAVRGYVALTQDTDLRHYVTLTAKRGARFDYFF